MRNEITTLHIIGNFDYCYCKSVYQKSQAQKRSQNHDQKIRNVRQFMVKHSKDLHTNFNGTDKKD